MNPIAEAWKREPVAIVNAIVGLVEAIIIVLTVMQVVEVSAEQQAAIIAVVISFGTVVQTIIGRSRVAPTKK